MRTFSQEVLLRWFDNQMFFIQEMLGEVAKKDHEKWSESDEQACRQLRQLINATKSGK